MDALLLCHVFDSILVSRVSHKRRTCSWRVLKPFSTSDLKNNILEGGLTDIIAS